MKCPRCQHENRAAAKFCDECATLLTALGPDSPHVQSYAEVANALSDALDQQAATAEILKVISSSPTDAQPVFDAIAQNAARLCSANDAQVLRVDGEVLRLVAAFGAPSMPPVRRLTRGHLVGRAVIDRKTIHVRDLAQALREYPETTALSFNVQSTLAVPLLHEGLALGVIRISRTEVRPFTDKQAALLQTFADQAVIAIENVRLFTELQEKNRALTQAHAQATEALEQQTATSELLRVISTSPTDLQPVFETIAENAVRLCESAASGVLRFDGTLIHLVAHRNFSPSVRAIVPQDYPMAPTRRRMSGRAILDGTVVHAPDILSDPDYPQEVAHSTGWRSFLSVPMLREAQAIGAVTVVRTQPGPFSGRQIELLKTFADQAVIAIENVRLFTELQEKNQALTQAHAQISEALEQQTATAEILRVISSSPTAVEPVFQAIVQSGLRLLGGYSAILLLVQDDQFHLAAFTSTGPQGDESVVRLFPVSVEAEPLLQRTVRERCHVVVEDVETEPGFTDAMRQMIRMRGWRSSLQIPMVRDTDVVGLIAITRREPGRFAADEITLLVTFAAQAVIAIENVRLFTELQEKNRRITEALEQQTATAEILRVISQSQTDAQPVFDTIVTSAVKLCDGLFGTLWRFDGALIHQVAQYNYTPEALEEMRRVYPCRPSRAHGSARAILDRAVVHIPDVEIDREFEPRALSRAVGWRSGLFVPMLREDAPIGAIAVTRATPGPFSENEITLLKTFADQAVIAIENVRLFNETKEALEQQTATAQILRVISSSPTDIQPVLDAVTATAARVCGATDALTMRVEGQGLRRVAHFGPIPLVLPAVRPLTAGSVSGRAIVEGRTIHIHDILATEAARDYPEAQPADAGAQWRTMLAVPLVREGAAIGAILIRRTETRPFTGKEIQLLETFASQAVIAIENVRLFKELEARTGELSRSVDKLTALGEVGRAVSSTLDLETVLTTIVSRAVELSGLDGGVVFEYDEDDQEFVHRAQAETGGALAAARRGTRIRKGEGVVGRTASILEPVQVLDITLPGAYVGPNLENLMESGVRAILAVPMVREGQLIGCLGVTRSQPGEFPTETIELLRTFATQSALAIQNARLFREIELKSRELEVASRHKSEFLANMSHELRTPLNAVIGFSEVLSEGMFGQLNDKQEEYARDIYSSGQHLLSLINDILDLSKIEAGRMELELTDFDLPGTLDNALTLVRERAGRRGIALGLTVDERLEQIHADERKVRQVVLNLLSNAIKFTPEGGGIEVRAVPVDGMVEISVSDTGVGIAPEDQEAIFEEFKQVGTAAKKVEGTGLGLALSRRFVELHGGRIWVTSQVGVGSTFTFTIPTRP